MVDSLDHMLLSKACAPTFIKMDIEGSEIDALNGAAGIIRRDKPKLAVCVYHKPSDLWKIPLLVHNLQPKYQFYLRHYSNHLSDTVLYAMP
jgi:hypothetical protein